ncbi:MAG TPA: 5-oxoprolinase subunit PxpA [Thermoanaerobaculia bacterium]|nr:5-oxoprolinase subunit PxpA [Thermoanaerobaculia bacterium]
MRAIDLSCDLGEATTPEELAIEEKIWPLITSANIACGGHVGDTASMTRAAREAMRHDVAIGAHPSYPDRENFGRKSMRLGASALTAALHAQLDALTEAVDGEGGVLTHIKPHGALYNDAYHDADLAKTIVSVCIRRKGSLAIVTSPDSAVAAEAARAGCPVIIEGFADRRYRPDGSLQPRGEATALILDFEEAASQASMLAHGGRVRAADGSAIEIPCHTICIHSDMPGAPERLTRLRDRLQHEGFTFQSLHHRVP